MIDYRLDKQDLAELRKAHRNALNVREAYRINAVILLAEGWSAEHVGKALLLDVGIVRGYFKRYREGGLDQLLRMNSVGSEALLDADQRAELDAHLSSNLYQTAEAVARWVEDRFGVHYTTSGMTAILHRLGYGYKKPKVVPGKADPERQEAFLEEYRKLKENKGKDEAVLFMDATHPQHNPVLSGGWIKRGKRFVIKSNTERQRLNINGAIDLEGLSTQIRFEETVNADATIALFKQIEKAYPKATTITIICDNTRYYRAKAVTEYLEHARIEVMFLPPYSPNLNLIERFWKFFKRNVLYNKYYETFLEYKKACQSFFEHLDVHAEQLRSLLTENFEIIRN
jgi:transposase